MAGDGGRKSCEYFGQDSWSGRVRETYIEHGHVTDILFQTADARGVLGLFWGKTMETDSQKIDRMYEATKSIAEKRKVLLIKDDEVMQKLIAVWPSVDKEIAIEEKMWSGLAFSYDQWCDFAGVPPSNLNISHCERLIKLDLIFPDGRIHYWITLFLDQKANMMVSVPRMTDQESTPELSGEEVES